MCINYKYYILIKNQLTNYSIILPNCIHFLPSSSPFLPPSLNGMHLCYATSFSVVLTSAISWFHGASKNPLTIPLLHIKFDGVRAHSLSFCLFIITGLITVLSTREYAFFPPS